MYQKISNNTAAVFVQWKVQFLYVKKYVVFETAELGSFHCCFIFV